MAEERKIEIIIPADSGLLDQEVEALRLRFLRIRDVTIGESANQRIAMLMADKAALDTAKLVTAAEIIKKYNPPQVAAK